VKGRRGRILIAAALFVACASTSSSTPTAPASASGPSRTPGGFEGSQTPAFAPAGEAAARYAPTAARDGRRLPPSDDVRRSLLGEVRAAARKAGVRPPGEDARLDWAMTDLAQRLRGDDVPALDVLEFLLGHYGLIEQSPHILLASAPLRGAIEMSPSARANLVEMMRTAHIGRVGVGIDRSAGTITMVFGLQETPVALLKEIPRRLPSGGRAEIAVRIAGDLTKPEVVITAPGGSVSEQTPPLAKGTVRGELRCAANGRYQVEIVATGATGSSVLANFPVYCGVAPPTETPRGAGVRPVAVTAEEAEQRMLILMNRDRKVAGVPPLVMDDKLAAIARAHTHDMVDHDFVGHVSPRTGNTVDRVHHAGLAPALISENVGRGYTVDEAEEGLMASPGHRANIVDSRAARVGIGIVYGTSPAGPRPLFVTQLFSN